jgi:hypothetical protein
MRLPGSYSPFDRGLVEASEDCNENGIPDRFDILSGFSADCQPDGIPDECQLAQAFSYNVDDGGQDGAVGTDDLNLGWWVHYVSAAGHETVTEIEIGWGLMPPSTPATIGLWSDPNGDGNPTDAQPLVLVPTVSALEFTGTRVRVDIPDTYVGPAGTSFFVGAYGTFGGSSDFPAAYDNTFPDLVSWAVAGPNPIQPDDLGAAGEVVRIDLVCCAVDWIVRAVVCPTGHCGESVDLNVNGVPDECDPVDCNGNGIEDAIDIALGTSLDCQPDGIPDECQLATELVLANDDGGWESALGASVPFIGWLAGLTVQPGEETVSEILVAWGSMLPGTPATVGLWSDPNGDGDPTDATLLVSVQTASSLELSGSFARVDIPDTFLGPPGTSFFVGAYGEFPLNAFPAMLDQSAPDFASWYITSATPIDPDDLDAGTIDYYGPVGLFPGCGTGCDGDFMLRASTCTTGHCGESVDLNANTVPDECDPDCNGNGVPDDIDILQGYVTDCNSDNIPDVCQALADCDGNGLPDVCQTQAEPGLVGAYYDNRDLQGPPLARIDPNVFFDFDLDPPFPGLIPTDNFSVRWTGAVTTGPAGTYTFQLVRDNGARLWVNGVLLVNEWEDSTGTETVTIDLAASTEYYFKLEYFEAGGNAICELSWQIPGGTMTPVTQSDFSTLYDRNMDGISDTCQVTDCNGNGVEDAEDIAFGTSQDCEPDGVPDECQCDDCDGNGLPDSCELAVPNGVLGQYFRTSGNPVVLDERVATQFDPNIDFDWGGGTPLAALGTDDFGIRWTGTLTAPLDGLYEFAVQSDDGVRFWLDGVLLVDEWHPSSGNEYTVNVNLTASSEHLLRLDWYEQGGDARIFLRWTPLGGTKVPVPTSALAPNTDIDGDGVPDLCGADCNFNGVPDPIEADANANCIPDACETGTAYWRLEEAGGATALDSSGNGLDGTLSPGTARTSDVAVATVPRTGAANTQSLDLGYVNPNGGYVVVSDPLGRFDVGGESFTLEGWVKLTDLSTNASPDERQWLFMKKPAAGADTQLEYAFLVQAGNGGGSGRELEFRYGDGSTVSGITSTLSIDDTQWHFVSVAYDARLKQLRFGLDGMFEVFAFEKPALSGAGQLSIGAHENVSAVRNQFVRGLVDELRFSRVYLPVELLLDAP